MLIRIMGLGETKIFYQLKECGQKEWKLFSKSIDDFIKMMFILFPNLKKEAELNNFTDKYALAKWFYNYGETEEEQIRGIAYIHFYHR